MDFILTELNKEERKFQNTIEKGLKQFEKIQGDISGHDAFILYTTHGFPIELIKEMAEEKGVKVDLEGYKKEFEKHQELSRTASQGKFKSGLADGSEKTTRLHTAAHLLLAALNKVLGEGITQKGSNINPERLRLDFNFERKLTDEEKSKVEAQVNEWIQKGIPVCREEMSLDDAKSQGAQGVFDSKYGDKVSVYTIENASKEICTGPHVENTKELGCFKIKKEQSVSAGTRRIKAVLN
jgi:alanyl-tRNA synthetase